MTRDSKVALAVCITAAVVLVGLYLTLVESPRKEARVREERIARIAREEAEVEARVRANVEEGERRKQAAAAEEARQKAAEMEAAEKRRLEEEEMRRNSPEVKLERAYATAIVYPASAVWRDYEENEVRADLALKGKIFGVRGVVQGIDTSILGEPVVRVEVDARKPHDSVRCYFDADRARSVAALSKYEAVSIVGVGDGASMGDPILRKCRIVRR